MAEIGRIKLIMHCIFCIIIIFIAGWMFYNGSPATVLGLIISWLYWKELRDSQKHKDKS